MSGTYRMQPPSPFPYSGGSRMEQALVPALQGPNSNSMLGYVLGAQLQRQADQMGYDREMDQYNLTTQQEAQRAQEATAADRVAQRDANIRAALINRHGAVMAPSDYNLTPEQRRIGTEFANANVDLLERRAEAAGRRGTGTGSTRPDVFTVMDARGLVTQENRVQAALTTLADRTSARLARELKDVYDPNAQRQIRERVLAAEVTEREALTAQAAALRQQRAALRPGATPQQPAAPTAAAPAGNQPTAQVDAGSPTPLARTTTAPAAAPQAVNPGSLPAEALAAARAAAGQIPGGQVRVSNQTGRPVVLDKDNNVVQRF